MHRYLMSYCLAFCFALVSPAASEEWRQLGGAEILGALSGRTLHYEDAVQSFLPSGRTSYDAGRLSWGYWRVEQGQYCSQWPPSDLWACYDVEAGAEGIRFVGSDGSSTTGSFR